MQKPQNIEDVIDILSYIIAQTERENSALGYFPSLYRNMTIAVQQGIKDGKFANPQRMERLDVNFAQRYLDAYDTYRKGFKPTKAWWVAFEAARQNDITVLQHLLLGINAHINLDLGIAAAQTCPDAAIDDLQDDFNHINDVIASLLDEMQSDLEKIWFPMKFINRITDKTQESIINFSITIARDEAWKIAKDLAPMTLQKKAIYIHGVDRKVEVLARRIGNPSIFDIFKLKAIKLFDH
jgi:hypothetical protein